MNKFEQYSDFLNVSSGVILCVYSAAVSGRVNAQSRWELVDVRKQTHEFVTVSDEKHIKRPVTSRLIVSRASNGDVESRAAHLSSGSGALGAGVRAHTVAISVSPRGLTDGCCRPKIATRPGSRLRNWTDLLASYTCSFGQTRDAWLNYIAAVERDG